MNDRGLLLITGAGRRIGSAIARAAAKAGWGIALHVNESRESGEALAAELCISGCHATVLAADFRKADEVQSLIRRAESPVLGLVNNASLFVADADDPAGQNAAQINFRAPMALIGALAAQIPADRTGAVVNILDGTPPAASFRFYAASKQALREQTQALARQYAPSLRINAVEPGPSLKNPRESHAHFEALVAASPLRRATPPEEIAAAVLFLLENPGVTGAAIPVNSGLFLKPFAASPCIDKNG